MPEKRADRIGRHSRGENKASGQSLRFVAYLRGRYNGGAFTKTVIDATMCAIIALAFIRDLLDFAGLSSNLARHNSVIYRLHRY